MSSTPLGNGNIPLCDEKNCASKTEYCAYSAAARMVFSTKLIFYPHRYTVSVKMVCKENIQVYT